MDEVVVIGGGVWKVSVDIHILE